MARPGDRSVVGQEDKFPRCIAIRPCKIMSFLTHPSQEDPHLGCSGGDGLGVGQGYGVIQASSTSGFL